MSNNITASALTSTLVCSTFTFCGVMNSQSAGGGHGSAKNNVYKDGSLPQKDGRDKVWDPITDLV